MLNSINLNDKSYEDLLAEAVTQIPLYSREWTNFNRSDPGITILQNLSAFHLLQQGCQQQAQPAQKIRQRLQGAVHHGGKLQCQPCQEAGQPVQQRQQQGVDAVQQQDQDHTVQQGQYGHQELAVAVLPLQVRLHVQQGEQDKGEQADQISRGPEDRLNHTAPPF